MVDNEYINRLAQERAKKQAETNKNSAKSIAKGFAQGGPFGAAIAAFNAKKAQGKAIRQSAEEMNKAMLEDDGLEAAQSITKNQQQPNDIAQQNSIQEVQNQEQQFPTNLDEFKNSLVNVGWDNNTINSAMNGLNLGNKEMADYINAYNQNAQQGQQIRIPSTPEEIALAKQGQFNTQFGNTEKVNDQRKLIDKLISGAKDFNAGYIENRDNAYSPENLQRDDSKNKMNRLGEAFGTATRMAGNPVLQGIIAGAMAKSNGAGITDSIAQGVSQAQKRAASNNYQKMLSAYGIDVPYSPFSNISSSDYNSMFNSWRQNAMDKFNQDLNTKKYEEQVRKNDEYIKNNEYNRDYKERKLQSDNSYRERKLKADNYYKGEALKVSKQKAAAYVQKLKNSGNKNNNNAEMGKDLAVIYKVINDKNITEEDRQRAISDFMITHNKDPYKLLAKQSIPDDNDDKDDITKGLVR